MGSHPERSRLSGKEKDIARTAQLFWDGLGRDFENHTVTIRTTIFRSAIQIA